MYSNFSVNLAEIVAQMLFLVFQKSSTCVRCFCNTTENHESWLWCWCCNHWATRECMYAVNSQNCYSTRSEDHDTGGCIIISEACTAHLVLLAGAWHIRVCHGASGGNTNVQGCFIQLSDVFDESGVLGRQSRTEKSFAVTRWCD